MNTSGLLKYVPGATVDNDGTVRQQCSVVETNSDGEVISETFYTPNSLVSFSSGIESADVCTHAVINGGPVEAIWRLTHDDSYEPEVSFEEAKVDKTTIYHYWGKDADTNGILISEMNDNSKVEVGVQKQIFHEILGQDTYTMDLFEMRVASQGYEVWYDWMANTCVAGKGEDAGWTDKKVPEEPAEGESQKTFQACEVETGKAKILSKFTGMPTYAQSSYVNRAVRAVLKSNRPSSESDADGEGIANIGETFTKKKKEMEENGNLKKLKALHSFIAGYAAKYGQSYFVRFPDDLFFCCTTDLEGVLTDSPGAGNWEQCSSGWHPQSDSVDGSGNSNAFVLNEALRWGGAALSNFVDEQGKCKAILEFDYEGTSSGEGESSEDESSEGESSEGKSSEGKTLKDQFTDQEVEVDFEKIANATQFHLIEDERVFLECSVERIYRACDANAFAETVGDKQVKVSGAVVSVSGGVQLKIKEDPSKQVVGLDNAVVAVTYNNSVADDDKIKEGNYVEVEDENGKEQPKESIYKRFQDLVRRHGGILEGNRLGPCYVNPVSAAVPLKSNQLRYGPKEYSPPLGDATAGTSEYESNTSLVPWEFGSLTAMNAAFDLLGTTKVSSQTLLESGSVKFTGTPNQIGISRLGDALIDGGPNITGVSITVGMGGVTTDVTFRTYTRNFGELAKNKLDMLTRMGQAQQRLQKAFNSKIAERYALGVSRKLDELENKKDKKDEEEPKKKKGAPKSTTSIVTQNHRIDREPPKKQKDGEADKEPEKKPKNYRFNTSVTFETTVGTSETVNSSSGTDGDESDEEKQKKKDYKRKASCSLDAFFRPYIVGGADNADDYRMPALKNTPVTRTDTAVYETCSFNDSAGYQQAVLAGQTPPLVSCCESSVNNDSVNNDGTTTTFEINSGALNPFITSAQAEQAGVLNQGTAPMKRVTRGNSYPQNGLEAGEGNAVTETPQDGTQTPLENVRSVGVAGPLIIVGWGYDTFGQPVPKKETTFSLDDDFEEVEDVPQFEDDWINKPHLWKAGPLDIRWDESRGMWVPNVSEYIPPMSYIMYGSLSEDCEPGGQAKVQLDPAPMSFLDATLKDGQRDDDDDDDDEDDDDTVVATNRLGQPLCKGQHVFVYHNPFGCEDVIIQAEFIPVTVVTDLCAYEKSGENTKGCLDLVATTRIIYVQSPPSVAVQTRWAQVRACDSCPSIDNPSCQTELKKMVQEIIEELEEEQQQQQEE